MPEHQPTAYVRGLKARSMFRDMKEFIEGSCNLRVKGKPVKGGPPVVSTSSVFWEMDAEFYLL